MNSQDNRTDSANDIAIIGMALRVPGARNVQEYWQNLIAGVESVRSLSEEELLAAGESPEQLAKPNYVRSAGTLDDIAAFDPEFFGLSPKEAAVMDPQHRFLLEVAWEALENAAHAPSDVENSIGVWAGCGMGSYFARHILTNPELLEEVGLFLLRHTGNDKDFLSTRISYCMDLRGPSVGVQTACSTSLVAVHQACQALLSRECDMALAGGVTIELPHGRGYLYEQGEILSPDGHCHAFDERAAGTVFGSGAGVVVLRRLEDAREDDHVYAVIKGTAINNDGSGKVGYLAPSVDGQAAAVAEALAVADIEADGIGYVECHGTGTAVGDPIEIAALTSAFRETTELKQYCAIGSVKSNIGHLDTAAGVASLIKASLALYHGKLPPSLNYRAPNPRIDFANSPFYVNDTLRNFTPAQPGMPRRAGVNSLGVGGTNAHVILEEAPPRASAQSATDGPELLLLSARNKASLKGISHKLGEYLQANPTVALQDVAHTLHVGRTHFQFRRVVSARSVAEASAALLEDNTRLAFDQRANDCREVVFMLPGGGSQYPAMGRHLYERYATFREQVDQGLALLTPLIERSAPDLLFPAAEQLEATSQLLEERPSFQLPLIFIIEFALAKLWDTFGVRPTALIGHSFGECTAACIAGVLSFQDALRLGHARGQVMEAAPPGALMSVPLAASKLQEFLGDHLDLACVNGPDLCVVAGPRTEILDLQQRLAADEIDGQLVRIQIAAHSRLLDSGLPHYEQVLKQIQLFPPKLPVISNRTGEPLTAGQAQSPAYWLEQLRHTVQFGQGIRALMAKSGRAFLEVGPGNSMCALARQNARDTGPQAMMYSLPRPGDPTPADQTFQAALGQLWACGLPLDLSSVRAGGKRIPLPTYAFSKQSYWIEPQAADHQPAKAKLPLRESDPARWFFKPNFRPHYPDEARDTKRYNWLFFADDTGYCQHLAQRLRDQGHRVVIVHRGPSFAQHSEVDYQIPWQATAEHYDTLLEDLAVGNVVPQRIVHGFLLSRPAQSPEQTAARTQQLGFDSLLMLAQALSTNPPTEPTQIYALSQGMRSCSAAETVNNPLQALLLGPLKVLPREVPGLTCSSIDLPHKTTQYGLQLFRLLKRLEQVQQQSMQRLRRTLPLPPQLAALERELQFLVEEFALPPRSCEVALRDGVRHELRYTPTNLSDTKDLALRPQGTYLITGGLSGVGYAVAESLARNEKAQLVLLGRTVLPPQEERATYRQHHPGTTIADRLQRIEHLESLGAQVHACGGDVADSTWLTHVLLESEAKFGPLHGVIHAAGVIDDAPIGSKPLSAVAAVLAPKVSGTLALQQALSRTHSQLDFWLLCSSTSTAVAASGQMDYVAANSFLDAYGHSAAAQSIARTALTLNFGIWADTGMAASLAKGLSGQPQSPPIPADYPLFSAHTVGARGEVVFEGELNTQQLWWLNEHRTGQGTAVLPGTGYPELIRAALAELGHTSGFTIEHLYFLQALDVPDAEAVPLRLTLRPEGEGYRFELHTRRRNAAGEEGFVLHGQGLVEPGAPESAPVTLTVTPEELQPVAADYRHKQETHLQFGPRWRVLRRMHMASGYASAELALPQQFTGDLTTYPLHPGLLDIATGFALELEPTYDHNQSLWVPLSYEKLRVFGPLPAAIRSTVRHRSVGANLTRFDIQLTSLTGELLVDLQGFTMKGLAPSTTLTPVVLPASDAQRPISEAEKAFLHNLSQGIPTAEGIEGIRLALGTQGHGQLMMSSIPVDLLLQQTDQAQSDVDKQAVVFERPELTTEYIAPTTPVEKKLCAIWRDLLGVDQVGTTDNFFELGGNSLVAVRLLAKLKREFGVEQSLSLLLERPTIQRIATLFPEQGSTATDAENARTESPTPTMRTAQGTQPRYTRKSTYPHLIQLNQGDETKRPIYCVHGAGGNILNFKLLADRLPAAQPFYAIQAQGVEGRLPPLESIDEMASAYLDAIMEVDPSLHYILAGYSGGGVVAYEMAKRVQELGGHVETVILFDTLLPEVARSHLSTLNKIRLIPRLNRAFIMRRGLARAQQLTDKLPGLKTAALAPTNAATQLEEASGQVFEAYVRAQNSYVTPIYTGDLLLFRVTQAPTWYIQGGESLGWDQKCTGTIEVVMIDGEHTGLFTSPSLDSMAFHLRRKLERLAQR